MKSPIKNPFKKNFRCTLCEQKFRTKTACLVHVLKEHYKNAEEEAKKMLLRKEENEN